MGPGTPTIAVDAVIFGGGGAGLWLLDVLVTRGVRAVLLEADRLGAGQTICAQGIIHGGLKYTLDGVLSKSAEAIRQMPALWRQCLAGTRVPSLRRTRVRAERCYLWRTGSVGSRLGMIGARLGLATAPRRIARTDRPPVLADCPGLVATVGEPVIDPASLLTELAERRRAWTVKIDAESGTEFELAGPGRVNAVVLTDAAAGNTLALAPGHVVLTAGAGNARLADRLGLVQAGRQQKRPLHMLLVRGELAELNGHCVDGVRTRVTITSDIDGAGRTVWQVGGQLAEDGVAMDDDAFVRHGAAEIRAVLPGIDLQRVEWASYRIDRAEASTAGARPHDVSVCREGNVIVAWPTKLALVPRLADQIADALVASSSSRQGAPDLEGWSRPAVARPPWEMPQRWSTGL